MSRFRSVRAMCVGLRGLRGEGGFMGFFPLHTMTLTRARGAGNTPASLPACTYIRVLLVYIVVIYVYIPTRSEWLSLGLHHLHRVRHATHARSGT